MTDLQILFDRDPLKLTNEDLTTIINAFRQARTQFHVKPKAEKKPVPNIDLGDLL